MSKKTSRPAAQQKGSSPKSTSQKGAPQRGTPRKVAPQKETPRKRAPQGGTAARSSPQGDRAAGAAGAAGGGQPPGWIGPAVVILGLVGIGISAYLTYAHYRDVSTICLEGMECDEVLSSSYAQILGIPLSVLGLGMYLLVSVLGVLMWRGPVGWRGLSGLGAYTVALAATLWSLYLYYLEAFEIHGFCTWCVLSSVVVFALMALTVVNLVRSRKPSREVQAQAGATTPTELPGHARG